MTRRALVVVREQRVLSAIATTFERRDQLGDALMHLDERHERRDRERHVGRWSKSCFRKAWLVYEDHGVRCPAVDETHRHRAVSRMVDRALALDEHPVAAGLALLDEPLDRASW
jgi:hypothetical protein